MKSKQANTIIIIMYSASPISQFCTWGEIVCTFHVIS